MPPTDNNDIDMKEMRREYPSGWMLLTRYQSVPYIIDALMEAPPSREFNKAELARKAGVSEKSVRDHISTLVELGVVTVLTDQKIDRYSLNESSPITQEIIDLKSAVKRVQDGSLPKSLPSSSRRPHQEKGPSNPITFPSSSNKSTKSDATNEVAFKT